MPSDSEMGRELVLKPFASNRNKPKRFGKVQKDAGWGGQSNWLWWSNIREEFRTKAFQSWAISAPMSPSGFGQFCNCAAQGCAPGKSWWLCARAGTHSYDVCSPGGGGNYRSDNVFIGFEHFSSVVLWFSLKGIASFNHLTNHFPLRDNILRT